MKKIIIIVAIVVVIAAAALYFFVFSKPNSEAPLVDTAYSPGEYFVTNVKYSAMHVKTAIVLTFSSEKALTEKELLEIKNQNHVIRNNIIYILRELTEDDLAMDDIQNTLRDRITTALKTELNFEKLRTVYFNDFVVQ